ncbi:MAG: AAA family ATPase, partial [Desulfobacteraceae bacterium]|nr:AAA family ATPase [Desulfobacteraceae bacterium]
MRILNLNLMAFGPFEGVFLDLSQGKHGLNIIYGPNEAGKTSALRALRQVFYGIPVRSDDNFRFPHNKMRIGATICNNDGDIIEFIRRKGKSNTLRAIDDESILDDSALTPFLKGVDVDLFSNMFGIDHSDLVKGGKEIITGGGNLGQLIFAAGSGITSIRDVQTELQNKADALFKPNGKLPLINASIRRVKENRKKIRDTQLASSDWVNHDQALQTALASKEDLDNKLTDDRTEKNRLERIKDALPIIAQRNELIEGLNPYASAILLPDNFSKQRREYISNLKIAENDQAQALENIKQLQNEIDHLNISDLILHNADTIESIYQELGGYDKAARDRIQLQTRMDILHSEAKLILQGLRDDLTIDETDQLRLNKKNTLHIQELGSRYERIITLIESTRKQIPGLEQDIQNISIRLSGLQSPRPIEKLYHAVEQAVEYAPLEKQYLEELSEILLAEQSLEVELARQSFWTGSIDEFERLTTPSLETIDVFEDELETVNQSILSLKKDIKQLEARLTETVRKTEELNLNFSVPTENDLVLSRKRRDNDWRIIASALKPIPASKDDSNKLLKQFPQTADLCSAFEDSMFHADEIADRLRREADRVATLAKLLSDKSDIEKKLQTRQEAKTVHEKAHKKIADSWIQQWSPAGIVPASPKEMRAWTVKKLDISSRFADIRVRKNRTQTRKTAINDLRQKLSQDFASIGEPIPEAFETLEDLVKRGKRVIEHEKDLLEKRKQLENEKNRKQTLLSELNIRTQINEKELTQWQQLWEQAVKPLGLDANALPAHAGVMLEELKSLFDKLKEAGVLQKRISGIDRDTAAFNYSVTELIDITAKDLAGHPADKAALEINTRLRHAQRADSKKQTLEIQINKENLRIRQSAKAIMDIQAFLQTMCEEAGCRSYKELSEAENRSNRRRELESEIKTVESQLLKLSAGSSIEDFVKESLTAEPDSIVSKIDTLSENIDILTKEKSNLDQTIGSERTELNKMDGSAHAAILAEETQSIIGSLEENIESYVRFKMAAIILNESIEKFRDKNQSPVLQKASSFFS